MNIILWCRDVPETYHQARTVLIPKVSGADRPEDFRPITVAPLLVRHLHKILADRLGAVRINSAQRAFIRTDGCADSTTLMNAIIRSSGTQYRNLFMAQSDLRKAFDMVDILQSWKPFGVMGHQKAFLNICQTSTGSRRRAWKETAGGRT